MAYIIHMWRMAVVGAFLLVQVQDYPSIQVGEDRLLSDSGPALPLSESQLSTHPSDPNKLLVGVIQIDSTDGTRRTCVGWTSSDGGKHWARHAFPVEGCADPWGVILADGTALMVMLGGMPSFPGNTLFLFRSADGGRSWPDTPLPMGGHHDHPMVIARGNEVYVVSDQGVRNAQNQHRDTVAVVRSQDGGKTFSEPTRVTASNLSYEAEGPTLLSDGTLVVGFHDHDRQDNKRLARPRDWLLRSTDHGQSFSEPLLVSESCEGGGGWPSMAAGAKDQLFWVCVTDNFNGVLVQRSDDRGESWSEPLRVNHREASDSRTPSIAVNKDGVVGVSWYERHDKNCLDTYFSASLDGGKSFLREVKISSAPSCPDTPQNKGAFQRFAAGGDYSGLASAPDGSFHIVWSDARSGIYQLRTASVSVKP